MKHYDIILVGAGLFNAVLAYRFLRENKSVLIIEERNHIAGNCYDETINGINVQKYGAHIFHTSNDDVWNFVNQFTKFNNFINSPIANYNGELYNLPFNMNTFYQLYGARTPTEAKAAMLNDLSNTAIYHQPTNLQEQALQMVGEKLFNKLIKEYTEKQWGHKCTELPPEIIKRIPLRYTFDNNYFNDKYQGIPVDGYTKMIERMIDGCDILLNTNYLEDKYKWNLLADKVYYSGCIDRYYDYCYGELEYRSLRFEDEPVDESTTQGVAVMNFTSSSVPYTRKIEHAYFDKDKLQNIMNGKYNGIRTVEYPVKWERTAEPYYPVNNNKTAMRYQNYVNIKNDKVLFVGRLGMYKYLDMDKIVSLALNMSIDM